MGKTLLALAWLCPALLALTVTPAQAYITVGRWSQTATNISTGTQGTPITLTWSFAPDGTLLREDGTGNYYNSNLIQTLDTTWGAGPGGSDLTERPWFPIFSQSYARLSALAGVTYVYESHDDGAFLGNSLDSPGQLGTRGDLRFGARSFGSGSSLIAFTHFPDFGDTALNSDKAGLLHNSANNYLAFRDVLMHESMHGLGFDHVTSSDAAFLIEPSLNTSIDGPQLDDLLALQRLYGDVYEKNGGNDSFSTATSLGEVSPTLPLLKGTLGNSTQILPEQIDFLSIDDDSDTDFFSFSLSTQLDISLQLSPRGTTYQVGPVGGPQNPLNTLALGNLTLALLSSNGTSILESANLNGAGAGETIARELLPGTYYARVKGLTDNIQLYQLGIVASEPDLPGDFNGDHVVNAADYAAWRNGLGSMYTPDDYDVWKANFGRSNGGGAAGKLTSVPEPASVALLILGIAIACCPCPAFRSKIAK